MQPHFSYGTIYLATREPKSQRSSVNILWEYLSSNQTNFIHALPVWVVNSITDISHISTQKTQRIYIQPINQLFMQLKTHILDNSYIAHSTKIPRNKFHIYKGLHPGELFYLNYSFWTLPSIHGFTSILSAICWKTLFSFTFSTRTKQLPLATITWFIKTLCRQGFTVIYIQMDKGGEFGRSIDFLKCITAHKCIFLGTGRAGSSLNGLIECPNRTIANSVRAKLLNSSLPDKFWCYAAEDTNYKLCRVLHSALNKTPYEAWTNHKPIHM